MKIAGVRFRDNWKVYDFDATDIELAVGDSVIVDSDRGVGFARVVRLRGPSLLDAEVIVEPQPIVPEAVQDDPATVAKPAAPPAPKVLRKIIRKATADDIGKEEKNKARESEAYTVAQEMITERDMPMKLIRVEYSFDASKATFYFFSESRIDFRELVKDLAFKLRSRIEMRQVGVRDVARMVGGFGPCGRELCCAAFLRNFEPVSIRMAKKQDMVLNPAKISGVCGRLLCCLSYEFGMYDEIKKDVAAMRQTAIQEKRDIEEQRISEVRQEAEELRLAEEKRQKEDRRPAQQEGRREKQRDGGGKKAGSRPEKKRDGAPQEKKAQPKAEQAREPRPPREPRPQPVREPRPQQSKQEPQPQTGQPEGAEQPQQETDQSGKKKNKRRFWRRKKKSGGSGGDNKPQGPTGGGE